MSGPQAVRNTCAMGGAALDGTMEAPRDIPRASSPKFESRVDCKVKQAAIRATA